MAEVICVCGRLCSGKTTYARRLCARRRAALLSVDEIMLAIFGQHAGPKHDEYAAGLRACLLAKAAELTRTGIDVVLDWGFWTRADRAAARAFFREKGVPCQIHYVEVSDATWRKCLAQRNCAVLSGELDAYLVDEPLAQKFLARFEPPTPDEIDLRLSE